MDLQIVGSLDTIQLFYLIFITLLAAYLVLTAAAVIYKIALVSIDCLYKYYSESGPFTTAIYTILLSSIIFVVALFINDVFLFSVAVGIIIILMATFIYALIDPFKNKFDANSEKKDSEA
ncbi:MAG: hypothetical protein PHY30_01145 [Candidatus Pacebacteria bacterium]|nr:hypothetical protein [Candidatus Paceibacterota bacterium]